MENQNGNQQSDTFYRYRGVTKCLSAGISFLTNNFLHIVKVSLPFALSYAVVMSAIVYILSNSSLMQTVSGAVEASGVSRVTLSIVMILLQLFLFVTIVFFTGFIFRLIHIHSHDISIKRYRQVPLWKSSLKYSCKSFWFFLTMSIIFILFAVLSMLPFMFKGEGTIFGVIKFGAFAIIVTLAFVFALPFFVSLPAMYLEKGKAFKNAVYGYKKGMKAWGKVFCLSLLVGIFIGVLIFVLSMPALTMVSAYNAATLSQLNGDSVHLPSCYGLFYAIVLFITYYLYSFIPWLLTVPYSYFYASVKVDEIEEAKNQLII